MKKLTQHIDNSYIEAMNRLGGKNARQTIVAYVESYEDIFFWSNLFRTIHSENYTFEVMLPSSTTLSKGKKIVLNNELGRRLGRCMIACVDADYDYLLQGSSPTSAMLLNSPFVFHTYVYAIENFRCFAPALRNVCVMATLNDRQIFDFESFFSQFSEIVWPLFVWNVWAYKYGFHGNFSMLDFYHIVQIDKLNFYHTEQTFEQLRHRVNAKIARLQKAFPQGRKTYKPLKDQLLQLGLTPTTTYLYMRGHDLMDGIVTPLLEALATELRREREREIKTYALHDMQLENELSAYRHASGSIDEMLRKHTGYTECPQFQKIVDDIKQLLEKDKT